MVSPGRLFVHGHEIDAIKLARGGEHGERLRPNSPDSRARVERGVINGPSEDAQLFATFASVPSRAPDWTFL